MMRNILLAITGASPQVVTETLYALHTEGKTFPDEMYIITTLGAKNMLCEGFFTNGHLAALQKEYDMPNMLFDESHIWLIEDDQGNPLDDAKSIEDQTFMADFITRKVFELTKDNDIAIHASIAGGRKTMAFYLGYAMSLFARPQDSLSHVFVDDEFEFVKDFYYPTKQSNIITGKNGQGQVDTANATITLAEIPFVRMRESVDKQLISSMGKMSFSQTVSTLNATHSKDLTLLINRKSKTLSITGVDIKLSPKELAFYYWLAEQKESLQVDRYFDQDKQHATAFLNTFKNIGSDPRVYKNSFGIEPEDFNEGDFSQLKAMENTFVQQNRSAINSKLKKVLPSELASKIEIKSDTVDNISYYHVEAIKQNITIDSK
ncbi:MAG: CRISPR-associated ring nuclease Csm6 [Psychromonas sp.]